MTDTKDLIEQLILVRAKFTKSREKYMNTHPTFIRNQDARITIFSRCIVVFDTALLYLMFRTFQLPSTAWWSSLPNEYSKMGISPQLISMPSDLDRLGIIEAVDSFWSFSNFMMLFSTLESSARTIVKVAYPTKFNDGRGNLTQIYERLLSTNYVKYKELLELFRLCRNTLHNNGVYFPEKPGDDRHISFKGTTYDFIDGNSVQLGDVSKLLFYDMVPELLKMIDDIINTTEVSKQSAIVDQSYV